MILMDTNICVAHLNGDSRVAQPMRQHASEITVPSLVAAELFYGFEKSARATDNLPRLKQFLQAVRVVDFDLATAEVVGRIKNQLDRIGKRTGEMDVLIAAVAVRHDALLVTNNQRHFENVPGLKLDNWLR